MSLKESALLVNFKRRTWSNRVTDRNARAVVGDTLGVSVKDDIYTKTILPRGAMKRVFNASHAAYNYHIRQTLPWLDGGIRMIPTTEYFNYIEGMNELRDALQAEVTAVCNRLPDLIEEAKQAHGVLFDPAVVPSCEELLDAYRIDIAFLPIPDRSDFRLSPDLSDELATELERQYDEQQALNAVALWAEITKLSNELVERLKSGGNFRKPAKLVDRLKLFLTLLRGAPQHEQADKLYHMLRNRPFKALYSEPNIIQDIQSLLEIPS